MITAALVSHNCCISLFDSGNCTICFSLLCNDNVKFALLLLAMLRMVQEMLSTRLMVKESMKGSKGDRVRCWRLSLVCQVAIGDVAFWASFVSAMLCYVSGCYMSNILWVDLYIYICHR